MAMLNFSLLHSLKKSSFSLPANPNKERYYALLEVYKTTKLMCAIEMQFVIFRPLCRTWHKLNENR